jgi:hypothetical protein
MGEYLEDVPARFDRHFSGLLSSQDIRGFVCPIATNHLSSLRYNAGSITPLVLHLHAD